MDLRADGDRARALKALVCQNKLLVIANPAPGAVTSVAASASEALTMRAAQAPNHVAADLQSVVEFMSVKPRKKQSNTPT